MFHGATFTPSYYYLQEVPILPEISKGTIDLRRLCTEEHPLF